MNLSALSIYDNVDTPKKLSKSRVNKKLNDLLNVNIDFELRIFCPLCVRSFGFKFSLFEHLKTFHDTFLTRANNQTLKFNECPFCNAKFYGKHLTAKHALHYHSKVIKALFVNKNKLKCFFCHIKLSSGDYGSVVNHFEQSHFLNFEEEFSKMFSGDITREMSVSELINSTVKGRDSLSTNWEDVCMKIGKHSKSDSDIQKFDEASKINYYDFRDLKEQLENIKDFKSNRNLDVNSANKSILKDIKNSSRPQKSARRVLRFDFPSNTEDNSKLEKNLTIFKKFNLDELNLICNDNKPSLIFKSNEIFCEKPKHSSTPNSRFVDMSKNENKKKYTEYCKSNFKSNISEKMVNKFDFQCGKCRLLFKENLDLVSHVKNKHKIFSLSAFQPCYHCAICNARFYKNCYLRKHHNLHKPY